MQIIFLGICLLGLGIQALLLKNKSKEPNFKPFTEDYKNKLAKFPQFLIIGIIVIGSGLLAFGIKGKLPSNSDSYSSTSNTNELSKINNISSWQTN